MKLSLNSICLFFALGLTVKANDALLDTVGQTATIIRTKTIPNSSTTKEIGSTVNITSSKVIPTTTTSSKTIPTSTISTKSTTLMHECGQDYNGENTFCSYTTKLPVDVEDAIISCKKQVTFEEPTLEEYACENDNKCYKYYSSFKSSQFEDLFLCGVYTSKASDPTPTAGESNINKNLCVPTITPKVKVSTDLKSYSSITSTKDNVTYFISRTLYNYSTVTETVTDCKSKPTPSTNVITYTYYDDSAKTVTAFGTGVMTVPAHITELDVHCKATSIPKHNDNDLHKTTKHTSVGKTIPVTSSSASATTATTATTTTRLPNINPRNPVEAYCDANNNCYEMYFKQRFVSTIPNLDLVKTKTITVPEFHYGFTADCAYYTKIPTPTTTSPPLYNKCNPALTSTLGPTAWVTETKTITGEEYITKDVVRYRASTSVYYTFLHCAEPTVTSVSPTESTTVIETSSVLEEENSTTEIPSMTEIESTTVETPTITKSTKCIPTVITVTEKEKTTVTERVTVTVTVNESETPSSTTKCAAKWAQCGGVGFNGPTCCESGSTCHEINKYYSQCY